METIVGAVLTICILSYVIGDSPLYRLATHVLVGVGAAFAVGVALSQVLIPRMVAPLLAMIEQTARGTRVDVGGAAFGLFGLLGCVFLFAKLFKRAAWLGNVAVGYVIGVGVGVAVGGALIGTLIPQTLGSALSLNPNTVGSAGTPIGLGGVLINLLILVSTVTVLLAFAYSRGAKRGPVDWIATLGRGFLYIALGATFALVFIGSAGVLSTLAREWWVRLFGGG